MINRNDSNNIKGYIEWFVMTFITSKITVFSKDVPKMLKVVFFGIVLCSFLSYSYGSYSNLGECVPPGKDVSLSFMGKGYFVY